MQNIRLEKIAVYCGSNIGNHGAYQKIAKQLAQAFIDLNITLVYGGAKVGIMGVIAETVLSLGGKAIGVIPQSLVKAEVAHTELTELHIVKSMHERKALIAELSDGFIMLPGGPGSWEEFFEIMTWAKLGYHQKPCGILNINNYYDLLIQFLDHSVQERFVHAHHRDMILIDQSPGKLLEKFLHYKAPTTSAWI